MSCTDSPALASSSLSHRARPLPCSVPPRADYLGSTALTVLVRCACGRRNYLERERWEYFGRAVFDNFRCVILYISLKIETLISGGGELEELNFSYEETPQRAEVVSELEAAQSHLTRASELLRVAGQRERAHKALNIAQQAAAQKCLLAQDWHLEDKQKAA